MSTKKFTFTLKINLTILNESLYEIVQTKPNADFI